MPDIDFYFLSPHYQGVLNALGDFLLLDGLFFALIGAAGTGKSSTMQRFIHELPKSTDYLYVGFPNVSPEELFRAVLENLGIVTEESWTKKELTQKFKEFLDNASQEGRNFVIFVDESQNLPTETLEELRILAESCQSNTLKVVLAGRPNLETRLNSEGLVHIKHHISNITRLSNLSKEETTEYINKRLTKASRNGVNVSGGAINAVWDMSYGNPRHINTIMERALMAAFMDGSHSVKSKHVETAAKSINTLMAKQGNTGNKRFIPIAVAAMLIIAGFGLYNFISYRKPPVQVVVVEPYTPPIIIETPKPIEPEIVEIIEVQPEVVVEPATPEPIAVPAPVENIWVTTSSVNVRANPALNGAVIGGLSQGQRIIVRGESGDWVMIEHNGRNGWVNKQFLRKN
jgi:general secretion pathway protein A